MFFVLLYNSVKPSSDQNREYEKWQRKRNNTRRKKGNDNTRKEEIEEMITFRLSAGDFGHKS